MPTSQELINRAAAINRKLADAYSQRYLDGQATRDLAEIYAELSDFLFALGMQQRARLDEYGNTYPVANPNPFEVVRSLLAIVEDCASAFSSSGKLDLDDEDGAGRFRAEIMAARAFLGIGD